MISYLLALISLVSATPKLFCYWESWSAYTTDFAAGLSTVPIKSGTTPGCDTVLLAFSDFTVGTDSNGNPTFGYINDQVLPNSTTFGHDQLLSAINTIHSKGGQVFISLGGNAFGLSAITTVAQANTFADSFSAALDHYGLDGVDFDINDSQASTTVLETMIARIKSNSPTKQIMFTIPAMGSYFNPWKQVLLDSLAHIDFVQNLFYDYYWSGYDLTTIDLANLASLGVPASKIVINLMPGCHDATSEPHTTTQVASDISALVKSNGNAGVGIWTVNRDTATRTNLSGCLYVTGLPSGTFVNTISGVLNA